MSQVNIDIGQINHSEVFARNLLSPCYEELKQRLQHLLNKPLPCTGELRPLNITADKGTLKHDCNQVTMIRTPILKNGVLFQRFFLSFPEVHSHKGDAVSKLAIDACLDELGLTINELRERFTGGCFDGQYFHLNIDRHFSTMLKLPQKMLEESLIWDAAHRLELVHDDVKNGKKDQRGNILAVATPWLQDLDMTLRNIMTKFRTGEQHSDLRTVAHSMNTTFLEFRLFSETRFMEYSHRTYDHFIQMFPVIYTKIKQDEEKAPSIDLETLERQLVQATVVIDLLFMSEISKAMAVSSKALQKFDVLPFEAMYIINKLKSNLQDAHSAFEKNECPNILKIDAYKLWDFFATSSKTIRETQHFKDVPFNAVSGL